MNYLQPIEMRFEKYWIPEPKVFGVHRATITDIERDRTHTRKSNAP